MTGIWNMFSLTGDQLFLEILNRSLAALPVMAAVLLARRLLKKLPRRITVLLWLAVFFRLVIPFTLESPAAILPQEEIIAPSAAPGVEVSLFNALDAAQRTVGDTLNGGIDTVYVKTNTDDAPKLFHAEVWLIVWGWLWPMGMAAMAGYSLFSLLCLKKRLVGAAKWEDNIWLCDGIDTPFVMGIFRPRIYLPSNLTEAEQRSILSHERTHIRHFDPPMKLFAWLGLCLHWFNPLVWHCFRLMTEDMETACDEAVTTRLPEDERADYADTLLRLATGKRPHATAPLAFGEGDPSHRIQRIFDFKKPKTAISATAALLAVVLGFLLITSRSHPPHLLGGGYQVSEILYDAPMYSFSMTAENAPDFIVTGDYRLMYRYNERDLDIVSFNPRRAEEWTDLGQFQRYSLDRGELDRMMQPQGWTSSWRPGRITEAWWLRPENTEEDINQFYLFMQTSAGEDLLAIGYEDISERHQGASDDTAIRWLFQLEATRGALLVSQDYFQLDAALLAGEPIDSISRIENQSEKWFIHAFATESGGYGIATYQWAGRRANDQLKDGFARLLQFSTIEQNELPYLELGAEGVYLFPEPVVTSIQGEPEQYLKISNTYDAVIVTNEKVYSVQRIVSAQDGSVLSEVTRKPAAIGGEGYPQMYLFSWEQEAKQNSCSVGYLVMDRDGNVLTVSSEPSPVK